MYKTKEKITEWLDEYEIKNYLINDDLTVDVKGDVRLPWMRTIEKIPFQFGTVNGNFRCAHIGLKSLEGAPHTVDGNFDCRQNVLTTLEGAPSRVGKSFDCTENKLTSLEFGPSSVGGDYRCEENELTTLRGCPEKVAFFNCSYNKLVTLNFGPKIISADHNYSGHQAFKNSYFCENNLLESLQGCPTSIGGDLKICDNKLSTFEHAPKNVKGSFSFENNKIENLIGMPEVQGEIYAEGNQIKTLEGSPRKIFNVFICDKKCLFLKGINHKNENEDDYLGAVVSLNHQQYAAIRRPHTEREQLSKLLHVSPAVNSQLNPGQSDSLAPAKPKQKFKL